MGNLISLDDCANCKKKLKSQRDNVYIKIGKAADAGLEKESIPWISAEDFTRIFDSAGKSGSGDENFCVLDVRNAYELANVYIPYENKVSQLT